MVCQVFVVENFKRALKLLRTLMSLNSNKYLQNKELQYKKKRNKLEFSAISNQWDNHVLKQINILQKQQQQKTKFSDF